MQLIYRLELRTTEPPSMKRVPEFAALCKATVRASSYVVPPTMNITTSWGLHHISKINNPIFKKKKSNL